MIVQLQRGFVAKPYTEYVTLTYFPCTHDRKDKIIWECNHGGQVWSSNAEYAAKSSFPVAFCSAGFDSLNAAFIISLLVDLVFQVRSHSDHRPYKTCPRFLLTLVGPPPPPFPVPDVHVLPDLEVPETN